MKKFTAFMICLLLAAAFLSGCSKQSGNFGQKSYTADAKEVTGIQLDVRDREITVSPSSDGQIHIDYFESEEEFYQISVSGDQVLTMAAVSNKEWSDYIGGKAPAENRKISLQIPDTLLESLTLSTTNEDVLLSSVALTESLMISANGGNIRFDVLDAGKAIRLNVKNGDIEGKVAGRYEDYSITCEIKKGDSNLPEAKEDGMKELFVSANNGDIEIDFYHS